MTTPDDLADFLSEHIGCNITFNEGGGATFCDSSSLANGDFLSIADARIMHLATLLADRENTAKAEAWYEGNSTVPGYYNPYRTEADE